MIPLEPTSYDTVPYRSLAFPQTHPDRLATIALMFGLSPADVTRCRVLELGCASGGNLIPMAFNLPGSTFVGIDLSGRQVHEAQESVQALGLKNITLTQTSILDIGREWGEFDYIICHGVFSWVDTQVQDKILQIAAQHLSANGIAYVSYNTYPGWHMREMVRHMMRYHAGRFDTPAEQIEQARALLAFLASVSSESEPYGQLLNREVTRIGQAPDSYLYHEHLEQTNTPIYFHQFIDRAERVDLQYLSEADVSDMLASLFPPPVAETLERISPDILHLEQYMDFVRNRQFRQTLLCRKRARPKRALTPSFMHGLMISSRATTDTPTPDLKPGATATFWNGKQRADVTLPASKAALAMLTELWPRAIAVDDLCRMAVERAAPFIETTAEEARRTTLADLFGGVMYGMLRLHTQAPACANALSETPRAHPVAVHQAASTNVVVNAHHEMFQLEPLGVAVLKLADGKRRKAEIFDALSPAMGGAPVTGVRVDRTLASLARCALLVD